MLKLLFNKCNISKDVLKAYKIIQGVKNAKTLSKNWIYRNQVKWHVKSGKMAKFLRVGEIQMTAF